MVRTWLVIAVGIIFILAGLLNHRFVSQKDLYRKRLADKRIPSWFGRVLFLSIGAVFLLFGFVHLIRSY